MFNLLCLSCLLFSFRVRSLFTYLLLVFLSSLTSGALNNSASFVAVICSFTSLFTNLPEHFFISVMFLYVCRSISLQLSLSSLRFPSSFPLLAYTLVIFSSPTLSPSLFLITTCHSLLLLLSIILTPAVGPLNNVLSPFFSINAQR